MRKLTLFEILLNFKNSTKCIVLPPVGQLLTNKIQCAYIIQELCGFHSQTVSKTNYYFSMNSYNDEYDIVS